MLGFFFFQAEDGIRDLTVTGVQTCALPISWQRTQVARHPQRPSTLDYIGRICDRFLELHGDRLYGDDHAIVAGLARLSGRSGVVIGPPKGKTLKERGPRNFGRPNPEGDRKALRPMGPARRVNQPGTTLTDPP